MSAQRILRYLIIGVGLALMVFGTVKRKPGAGIIGLIVAAVNIRSLTKDTKGKDSEN
jgi:hypothetical protein